MPETAHQLALPLETHRNHYLFSDHYLNELLPQQAVWREAETEARRTLEAITAKYREVADALPHYNEAQVERHWIQPVLDILGHVYEVQPALPGAAGTPDYAFFADEAAKGAATPRLGTAAFWETALAVGDAKRWERPLDRRILDGAPDAFTNANPCYQIDYYLRHTSCTWGLVSNGRRWRLYHRDSSYKLDVFYEVDLAQLIEQEDVAAFRYFYLFFRADAFRPDAEGPVLSQTKGRCWLDTVLAESAAYAVRVGDELTDRVYEALRLLAQGFLDYLQPPLRRRCPELAEGLQGAPAARRSSADEGTLDTETVLEPSQGFDLPHIHDACLILLYRLLFLFYAESRGLLPLDNPSYRQQYSLKAIKEDIAAKLEAGVAFLPRRATLCDDLKTLFGIIYEGNEALGVPAYNGGLFDPAKHPFLEEHTIGDRYLAQTIDLLARAEAKPGQGLSFVDYRDLSIRHLGSIYERLLEYRLEVGGWRLEIADGELWVELVTDRGERKATGSYYTPDYIVKYIVEQTLGPLADAQAEAVDKEVAALKARNRGAARRTKAYKDELARLQNSFADRILALNVLDPAMGSGHFLVEATDYLARRIVEAGVVSEALTDGSAALTTGGSAALTTGGSTQPVLRGAEGLTGTGNEESELSYWRRRVVERCIYGVDLNPLAVELAKLSLWLATVAKGKPLSFLDHHLRCGNSLIGARVADLQALPVRKKGREKTSEVSETSEVSQLAIWDESAFTQDMFRVVGAMQQIQEYESADLVTVQEKERIFAETVERERRKWRDIADLWTAAYFGLELTPQLYNACVQHAQGKPVLLQAAQAEALLAQAHQVWEEKRFFHWEIEFPEVFFDQHGRHKGEAAGFDAVVGNPPYDVLAEKELGYPVDAEKHFFESNPIYAPAVGRKMNLYRPFVCVGIDKLKQGGRFSYIVPMALLGDLQAQKLRRWLLQSFEFNRIEAFPQKDDPYDRVFFAAKLPTCIFTLTKRSSERKAVLRVHPGKHILAGSPSSSFFLADILNFDPITACIPLLNQEEWELALRLSKDSSLCRCKEIGSSQQGEVNLTSHRRFLSENPPGKVVLRGAHIGRYEFQERPKQGTPFYLDVDAFLSEAGKDTKRYHYKHLRIGYQRGAALDNWRRIIATIIDPGEFCSDTINYFIEAKYDLYALLALLNASVAEWRFRLTSTTNHVNVYEIDALPMPRFSFTTPPEERARLVEEGLKHEEREIARVTRNAQDTFAPFADFRAFRDSDLGRWLEARLSAEPEQADVVHDFLAHLAERMIEMHQHKQAEVKGFLGWLADYTGRPVDDWALKTNLHRYYEHDWAEMQRILKRNQRKLPKVDLDVDAYRNEPAQKIGEAWETSMEMLRPLLACIAATDRLIDRIVYQLYGLTEEEVGIVEERAGG